VTAAALLPCVVSVRTFCLCCGALADATVTGIPADHDDRWLHGAWQQSIAILPPHKQRFLEEHHLLPQNHPLVMQSLKRPAVHTTLVQRQTALSQHMIGKKRDERALLVCLAG
jgi:hypothetical protein